MNTERIEQALRAGPVDEPRYVRLGSVDRPERRGRLGSGLRATARLAVTAMVALALVVAVLVFRSATTHRAGPPSGAVDYPMYKGNPGHTGEGAGPAPIAAPKTLWSLATGDSVWSSAAVVGDALYIVGGDGNLRRLDAATGAERWRTSGATYVGSPAVSGGRVFVLDTDGALGSIVAIDAANGSVIWRQDTRSSTQVWPLPVGDLIVAGGPDRTFRAFDAATGVQRWSTAVAGGDITRSPSSAGDTVFFGTEDGVFHAVDGRDGHEIWTLTTQALYFGSSAVRDGTVYVVAQASDATFDLLAIDATTGHEVWSFSPDVRTQMATPSVDGDTVFLRTIDGHSYAVWRDDGTLRWMSAGAPTTLFPITLVGDSVLTFEESTLVAIDRSSGRERWRLDVGAGPNSFITAVAGRLFIGTPAGDVIALGSGDSVAPSGSASPSP